MKYTRNPDYEQLILDRMWGEVHDPSRVQPSVSGMIKCLTLTYYEQFFTVDGEPQKPNRDVQLLFATGLALEKVMLGKGQDSQAGILDGITWHIDDFNEELIETKSTRISSKKAPDNYTLHWLRQILAYMKAKEVLTAKYVVLHLMGGYSPPFPELIAWDIEATQEEVDANWEWMKIRAETYKKFVAYGLVPTPFQFNESWECERCAWKVVCDATRV